MTRLGSSLQPHKTRKPIAKHTRDRIEGDADNLANSLLACVQALVSKSFSHLRSDKDRIASKLDINEKQQAVSSYDFAILAALLPLIFLVFGTAGAADFTKTVALAADNSRPEFGGADNQTVFDQEPSFAGDLLLRAPSIGRFCDGKTPPSDPNSKCL